jgi:hypothetical protein
MIDAGIDQVIRCARADSLLSAMLKDHLGY